MIDQKTAVLADLVQTLLDKKPRHALVVGCGKGFEAVDLAILLHCKVDAIDVYDRVNVRHPDVSFHIMDARAMEFADNTFDLVYSFHALEHIPEPERAIREMRRVLCQDGIYCIGTPNRSRLLHNLGCRDASVKDTILSNLWDWSMRLRGRFRNEYGAHAGFTRAELLRTCSPIGPATAISAEYYLHLYPHWERIIRMIIRLHASRWIFPSEYLLGRRMVMDR